MRENDEFWQIGKMKISDYFKIYISDEGRDVPISGLITTMKSM